MIHAPGIWETVPNLTCDLGDALPSWCLSLPTQAMTMLWHPSKPKFLCPHTLRGRAQRHLTTSPTARRKAGCPRNSP